MPIRFGVQIGQEGHSFEQIKAACLESESLGFDSFWLTDHFFSSGPNYPECWTTLSALASVTTRIRLGTLTLCNNFRNPSLLAKMATTLDNISHGRLDIGIGAGRLEAEHTAYGFPYPGPKERVERLAESIVILKKMFTEPRATFHGKYYSIQDAPCEPGPIQRPHPPIWVGGSGKRLLGVAAELADGWNVVGGVSREEYEGMVSIIRANCERIGRSQEEIRYSWHCRILLGKNQSEAERRLYRYAALKRMTMDEARKTITVVGTPSDALRKIETYSDLIGYVMIYFPFFAELDDLRMFAKDVIPGFV